MVRYPGGWQCTAVYGSDTMAVLRGVADARLMLEGCLGSRCRVLEGQMWAPNAVSEPPGRHIMYVWLSELSPHTIQSAIPQLQTTQNNRLSLKLHCS